ncbi:MAG: hypothetical protein KH230_15025 [Enterocloster asparagiformis]|nr:hypothetical protein [Enterocloster asparagiformis]
MKHYIIVKYNGLGKSQEGLSGRIRELFLKAGRIQGVHGVSLHTSVIDLPNRYDLMICIDMEPESLPLFDASDIHREWKAEYARFLEAKTIFDCE